MAIGHRATGTATFGINGFSPAIPAAQVTGDMMLLLVGGKPFDSGISVGTAGWQNIGGTGQDGTVGAGVDVGSMFLTAWWKVATSDTETDPALTEGSPTWNIVGGIVMVFSKGAGEGWHTPVFEPAGDSSAGTDFSATALLDPGIMAGDHCVTFAAFRSDAATPCTSHITPTASGVTFTNTHDPATDPETTSGGDMGMCVTRSTVTGTSAGEPTYSATLAAAHTGTAGLIRLRVSHSPPTPHRSRSSFYFRGKRMAQRWLRDKSGLLVPDGVFLPEEA